MTNIQVAVAGRDIQVLDGYEKPSAGDVNTCSIAFELTGLIAELPHKRVTFSSRAAVVTVDYADEMQIPPECIPHAGALYLTVTGYNADGVEVARTHRMTYPIEVAKAGDDEGASPTPATLDVVSRIDALADKLGKSESERQSTFEGNETARTKAFESAQNARTGDYNTHISAWSQEVSAEVGKAAEATTQATSAADTATKAAATVESAITTAESAAKTAESAAETARTAASAAETSATKADTSAANADTATTAAQSATTAAQSATAAAKAATDTAQAAATTADTAAGKADTAAASATSAAQGATSAATAATTAAQNATTAAGKVDAATEAAKAATEDATQAAETAYAAAKAVETATLGLSPAQISAMVKMGNAPTVLPVGSQIYTTLSGNGYNVEQFAWDVVHHFDGSDEDHPLVTLESGKQVKGMMLQAHRTVPWGIIWEPKQAAIAVTGDMPAGTYHFTVKVTTKWSSGIAAEVGEKTYQFTTTQALSAGAQLVYTGGESTAPTSARLQVYASNTSTAVVETCPLSLGSGGTDLGVMTDATPSTSRTDYALLNNIQRMIYGSNRWATSQEREALNAATVAQGGTEFSRPWGLVGKTGLPACLPKEFVSVLGKVERKQVLHPWDGGEVETTYDTFFPVSAREHGFSNFLIGTAAGFKAEGVPLDYWTQLRAASGRTVWNGWNNYPELIAYDSVATTTARNVRIRTAFRSFIYADCVGCVYSNGTPSHISTRYVYYSIPACIIV